MDADGLMKFIQEYLDFPMLPSSCFIHCCEFVKPNEVKAALTYCCFPLSSNDPSPLDAEISSSLNTVFLPRYSPQVQFSVGNRSEFGPSSNYQYDADFFFGIDGSEISDEIRKKVEELKNQVENGKMLETLLFIISQFREAKPELCM